MIASILPSVPSVVHLLPVILSNMKMRIHSSRATAIPARCGIQVCILPEKLAILSELSRNARLGARHASCRIFLNPALVEKFRYMKDRYHWQRMPSLGINLVLYHIIGAVCRHFPVKRH